MILLADPSVCGQTFKVNSNSKWKLAKADKKLVISEKKIEHINIEVMEEESFFLMPNRKSQQTEISYLFFVMHRSRFLFYFTVSSWIPALCMQKVWYVSMADEREIFFLCVYTYVWHDYYSLFSVFK